MSSGKALKTVIFTAIAQDHHNAVKIKSVLKWLKTGHEVRIQINGKSDRQKAMENLSKQLESQTRAGARVIQKVVKPESIKFYLRPTEDAANIVVDDTKEVDSIDVDELQDGKDVFSDEFQTELEKSITEDVRKSKKR